MTAASDLDDAPPDLDGHADVEDHPVVLFDGVCNLCTGTVQFVIERDPEGTFRFAPLQSAVGTELLAEHGLSTDHMSSFVLLADGEVYTKSGAAIRIARRLGLPYSLLTPFLAVPKPIRDAVYDLVATHRYRIFGKRESCMVPTDDVRERFLATSDGSE